MDRIADIVRGVVTPLHSMSDTMKMQIEIEATNSEGFDEGQLNNTVREKLKQLQIQPEEDSLT